MRRPIGVYPLRTLRYATCAMQRYEQNTIPQVFQWKTCRNYVFLEFKARPERITGLYQPVRFPKKTPCRFSRQLYTSFQLMGSPVPMVREFVRMGRVIIRSWPFLFEPTLTMTGRGMLALPLPIRLIDGTCLNFLVSIMIIGILSSAKVGIIS